MSYRCPFLIAFTNSLDVSFLARRRAPPLNVIEAPRYAFHLIRSIAVRGDTKLHLFLSRERHPMCITQLHTSRKWPSRYRQQAVNVCFDNTPLAAIMDQVSLLRQWPGLSMIANSHSGAVNGL